MLLASLLLSFTTSFININIPTVEASEYPPDFGTTQDIKLHVYSNEEERNAMLQRYYSSNQVPTPSLEVNQGKIFRYWDWSDSGLDHDSIAIILFGGEVNLYEGGDVLCKLVDQYTYDDGANPNYMNTCKDFVDGFVSHRSCDVMTYAGWEDESYLVYEGDPSSLWFEFSEFCAWLRSEWGYSNIYLFGHSAGAIALAYAITRDFANVTANPDTGINGVVLASGIYDWNDPEWSDPLCHSTDYADQCSVPVSMLASPNDTRHDPPYEDNAYENAEWFIGNVTGVSKEVHCWDEENHNVLSHTCQNHTGELVFDVCQSWFNITSPSGICYNPRLRCYVPNDDAKAYVRKEYEASTPDGGNMTFEARFKIRDYNVGLSVTYTVNILLEGDNDYGFQFYVTPSGVSPPKMCFKYPTDPSGYPFTPPYQGYSDVFHIDVNEWITAKIVHVGTDITLYINGEQVGTEDEAFDGAMSVDQFLFGIEGVVPKLDLRIDYVNATGGDINFYDDFNSGIASYTEVHTSNGGIVEVVDDPVARTDSAYEQRFYAKVKIDDLESDYSWDSGSDDWNFPTPFEGAFFYGLLVGGKPYLLRFIEDSDQLKVQYIYVNSSALMETGATINITAGQYYNFTMVQNASTVTFYKDGNNEGNKTDAITDYDWTSLHTWIGEGSQEKVKSYYDRDETAPDPDYIGHGGAWVEEYMTDFGSGDDEQRYFGDDFEDWGLTTRMTIDLPSPYDPAPQELPDYEMIDDDPKDDEDYQTKNAYFKTVEDDSWIGGIRAENPNQYNYAYLQDAEFMDSNTQPDPKWFNYLWKCDPYGSSVSSTSSIHDGRLFSASAENGGLEVAGSGANQGKQPHLWGDYAKLLGTNTTLEDASFSDYIYFEKDSEPTDYWLETKVKITKRQPLKSFVTGHYRFNPLTTVDVCFLFEYIRTVDEEERHPQYDHPNAFKGRLELPSACILDVFLDYTEWSWGTEQHLPIWDGDGYGHDDGGWVEGIGKYDADLRALLVQGQILDIGIWHTFTLNMTWLIEQAFWMLASKNVHTLILRGVIVAVESCGAEISAEWDYVMLYHGSGTKDFTVNSIYYDGVFEGQEVNIPFYIDGTLMGCTPKTLSLTEGVHSFWCSEMIYFNSGHYRYDYNFFYYLFDDDPYLQNPLTLTFSNSSPSEICMYYKHIGTTYTGGRGGGGGGGIGGKMFMRASPLRLISSDYGRMSELETSGAVDDYLYVDLRQTLGNTNGTICFDIYTEHAFMTLDVINIEQIQFDLGQVWTDNGRNQYFNPFSYNVDDVTVWINIDNVSSCEIIFKNVPNVLHIEKNMVEMEKGVFWDYIDGNLYLYMDYGDPEIFIDFETMGSITMEGFEAIVILLFASMILVMIKKWRDRI